MSKKKKKKNKKKKLQRLREIQAIEGRKEEVPVARQKKSEIKNVIEEPKEEVASEPTISESERKEEVLEGNMFRQDLRRVIVVILICLIILVGLVVIYQYTSWFSPINSLLPK
jgi:hypothetical protein